MTEFVYLDPPDTESLEIEIPGDGVLDLTTVTAVTFEVTKPGGTEVSWTAAITSAAVDLLICEHAYDPGDVSVQGSYRVMVHMTVPAGTERAGPVYFEGVQ